MSDNAQKPLASVADGEELLGFFALKKCELRDFDGGSRLDVELGDAGGSVAGVVWDDAPALKEQLRKGVVVKVKGKMGTFRDKPQVRVERIRAALPGEFDPTLLLPRTPADVDMLVARLKEFAASIADVHLARLVSLVFDNETVLAEYVRAPGGVRWHHPYLGGLLEHSVGVTQICDAVARLHPELDRDLVVTAALLHDIGKIREFTVGASIDYSDEGRLVGHIILGERFVMNMVERIENFPPRLRTVVSHLMLAHQGFKAFSSPVEPMIPEGFVLYYADELDSKLNALNRIVKRTRDTGESWSDYVKLLDRFIYAERQFSDAPGEG